MSHLKFWNEVIFATRILWIHSQTYPLLRTQYVKDILKFLQNEMTCNFRVLSWEDEVFYVMNDFAEPSEDMTKLFHYLDERLPSWENHHLILGYRNYLEFLLDKYVIEYSCAGA